MRQIEFRGLRTDGKGWAYGDLIRYGKFTSIREHSEEEMGVPIYAERITDPSTVGQFTGLYDRNGVKVFEGDTVTINGKEYFIRFNMGVFVAESVTANHLSLIAWEFNGTDITVTGNIHEQKKTSEDEAVDD